MMFTIGLLTGWVSLMTLRWVLYRLNKTAMDIELRKQEDEELLKQYKDG